jgi:hypothetical protein
LEGIGCGPGLFLTRRLCGYIHPLILDSYLSVGVFDRSLWRWNCGRRRGPDQLLPLVLLSF